MTLLNREELEQGVVRLTIAREEALNALNREVLLALLDAFDALERDGSARVVLLTSKGTKAFVAGADVAQMAAMERDQIAEYVELGQRVMRRIEQCPVPVIALVQGYALGGGLELAMACDLIVAADSAKLGQPEVNLGIVPGFGGTQRLLQRCSVGFARRLVYSGEMVDAESAQRAGLVDWVVPRAQLAEEGERIAKVIASKAPLAVRAAKQAIREGGDAQLRAGLRVEVDAFLALFATADREEGMGAFLAKRPAQFRGA